MKRWRRAEDVILESVLERDKVRVSQGARATLVESFGWCFMGMKTIKAVLKSGGSGEPEMT